MFPQHLPINPQCKSSLKEIHLKLDSTDKAR